MSHDIDRAAQRIAAPERTLRAAHRLYPIDLLDLFNGSARQAA